MNNEARIGAHPIDLAMRVQIHGCLQRLDADHDVKVLFACESGSHGWGFASPDIGCDLRFIDVNRLAWYLTVEAGRDVIEQPISGHLDVDGWDLRKTLQLLRQSNPTLLEWLRSPIVHHEEADTVARLRALADDRCSAVRGDHHDVSMAEKNFREHLRGEEVRYRKHLYERRPRMAARWVRNGKGVPPMRFAALGGATIDERVPLDKINRPLEVTMRAGEAATSPRWTGIHDFIESELAAAGAQWVAEAPRPETSMLDAFLYETVQKNERENNGTG